MLNVPINKPKLFYLVMGIFVSVLIFYINHFSSLLGENNKLSGYTIRLVTTCYCFYLNWNWYGKD